MHIMRETDIAVNRDIVGIGKIESLRLSKLIHMQLKLARTSRCQSSFSSGISLVVSIIFFGTKQVIL